MSFSGVGQKFKSIEFLIYLVTLATGGVAFTYTTFATVKYVDTKHDEVSKSLHQIRDTVQDTRDMVQFMKGRMERED